MTSKRQGVKASPVMDRLMDAAVDLHHNPDAVERSYMARQLVQVTLPHSDPGDVNIWVRTNGDLTLAITPFVNRQTRKPMYPYGSVPRLLLFWLCTEAVQKKSRRIVLGNSLDKFMREIGLNPRTGGGKRGDAARLHAQAERLFRASISFEDRREGGKRWVDMPVGPEGELWWEPTRSKQDNIWESWVELGERFYEAITVAPVPVDLRVIKALKRSPLALDLYALLTYTAFSASRRREPRIIPWDGLHGQMGAHYADVWEFKRRVLLALKKIQLVYPALKVEAGADALTVSPSRTSIAPRS